MSYAFQQLSSDYASLLPKMTIDLNKLHAFEAAANRVLSLADKHDSEWSAVTSETGVPRLWGLASFERESSSDYRTSPAQGDRWDRKSVNVPRGLGPYPNWGASCVAAYRIDHLERVGAAGWTWIRAAYEGEIFNGMGYRSHGFHSAYIWAGTNVYNPVSKYNSDGHFVPGLRDSQLGLIPLMFTMVRMRPALALADAFPSAIRATDPPPPPAPAAPPVGLDVHSTVTLQRRLGLDVDGNYGRLTKRAVADFQKAHSLHVDGLAGPVTWAALDKLAAA